MKVFFYTHGLRSTATERVKVQWSFIHTDEFSALIIQSYLKVISRYKMTARMSTIVDPIKRAQILAKLKAAMADYVASFAAKNP
ncbi:hypothetical protein GOP47_0004416 [Adiantum capillus-veneris]|uniref:Uncharacterized protein n=1 Tax=Adiantum capillus-veneris TaxID=13818 RepID=A0A9D4ZMK5_ADICA|nr:hypothetical protein GOP47_0004416 [Adiantum capillus-veneris]